MARPLCRVVRDLPLERLEVEAGCSRPRTEPPRRRRWPSWRAPGTGPTGRCPRTSWRAVQDADPRPRAGLRRPSVRERQRRRHLHRRAARARRRPAAGRRASHPARGAGVPPRAARVRRRPAGPLASWLVERTPVAPVLLTLVIEALTRSLRHDQGLVYEVDGGSSPVDDATLLAVLWADGAEEGQVRVLESTVGVLRDLAASGPEPSELAHEQAVARQRLTDPAGRSTGSWSVPTAPRGPAGAHGGGGEHRRRGRHARGRGPRRRSRPRDPAARRSRPAPGGIAGVPDRTDDEPPPVPEVTGRPWTRRLLSTAPRDLRVVIGESGMTQTAHGPPARRVLG